MNVDLIHVTQEGMPEVISFAAEFGHPITGRYETKLVMVNKIPVGYVEIVKTPILSMGWKHGHAKEVVTAIRTLKASAQLSWGECLALSDPKSDIYKHLGRLGFKSTNLELVRGE